MIEPLKILAKCLDAAQEVDGELAIRVCDNDARLCWLEKQLANVVAQLQAMISDIESGLSLHYLGFSCDEDFEELVGDLEIEIANLKGQIRTLREVGR